MDRSAAATVTFVVISANATFANGATVAAAATGPNGGASAPTLTARGGAGPVTVLATTPGVPSAVVFRLHIAHRTATTDDEPTTSRRYAWRSNSGSHSLFLNPVGLVEQRPSRASFTAQPRGCEVKVSTSSGPVSPTRMRGPEPSPRRSKRPVVRWGRASSRTR